MEKYDTDKDGKLNFINFIKIILPKNYDFSLIKKKYEE
jgi:hypothetical protein